MVVSGSHEHKEVSAQMHTATLPSLVGLKSQVARGMPTVQKLQVEGTEMKLTGKVTGRERIDRGIVITGDIDGGGYFHKFINEDNYDVDDEITVTVERKVVAREPGAPAPWEQPIVADEVHPDHNS